MSIYGDAVLRVFEFENVTTNCRQQRKLHFARVYWEMHTGWTFSCVGVALRCANTNDVSRESSRTLKLRTFAGFLSQTEVKTRLCTWK